MDQGRRSLLVLGTGGLASAWAAPPPPAAKKKAATKASPPSPLPVRWKPRPLFNGSPVLFESKTLSGPARWLGKPLEFRKDGDSFTALAGVDLSTKPGRHPLVIGETTVQVTVISRLYPSSRITVEPKFLEPPKEVQKRLEEEREIKKKAFSSSKAERLWQGRFEAPTNSRHTSPFGSKRVYNGKTRSIHQGLDFAAATGTTIHAANSGRVAIAQEMYFEGGFVVIDHGESFFTMYMHLSEFLVTAGMMVEKGQPIAKSGASGRVTGPHLHFAVQWRGSNLEPATLLRL